MKRMIVKRLTPILTAMLVAGCASNQWQVPNLPEGIKTSGAEAQEEESVIEAEAPSLQVDQFAIQQINRNPAGLSMAAGEKVESVRPANTLSLQLEGVGIRDVVAQFADILKFDYVMDPGVKGKVTLRIQGDIAADRVWPLFTRVLNLHGATIVKENEYYRILPVESRLSELPKPGQGYKLKLPQGDASMVVQFLALSHLAPEVMAQNLEPFLGNGGLITPVADSNMLYIVDNGVNMRRLLELADALDQSAFQRKGLRFMTLSQADAIDVAAELESIFNGVSGDKASSRFIPLERINGLLVVSDSEEELKEAERWIALLDKSYESGGERVFIYRVQNVSATELSDTLNEIYASEGGNSPKSATGSSVEEKSPGNPMGSKATTADTKASRREVAAGTVTGNVQIIPDSVTNALIIKARPSDYESIKRTVQDLDSAPLAVAINVFIAELTLNDGDELGTEFTAKSDGDRNAFKVLNGLAGSTLTGGVFTRDTNSFNLIVRAYSSKNRLNVLSSPTVVVRNNEPASIEVGADVPVLTQNLTNTSSPNAVTSSIEYRYAGIQLKVTPHINEDGIVTMELRQEVSSTVSTSTSGIDSPSFNKRVVETALVARDGETVFMGGLLERRKETENTGVLGLSNIPLLGALFRKTEDKDQQVELIMAITPVVLYDFQGANKLSRRYLERIDELRVKVFDQ